ncbi:hypothetical protein AN639_03000 [Candidatus Epulonipiscium fishelsonii]|uniref:Uncharacterized protein n=1 Tax=Candidatus Epulonipiscium fishelsonii TaxID=77094 RepID=A0ACC8X9J9_9FIRM|nr:hypothetical protein AN396_01400 [Epulopiscium sp. SCG-B11WGA-EpuloA1]ONI41711.1 hypothetical protein AN639_03000 [Epulopiscium sp. SCG-B05WGA-EpuloA1]
MIDLKELMNNRRNIYQLLTRLFQKEIDTELYNALKTIKFPTSQDKNILKEYHSAMVRFNDYFEYDMGESIDDLAVDYAKTFLGAGIAQGASAFPYESVYTSPKRMLMQDAWVQVISVYEQNGLERNEDAKDLLEDHIAVELNFMSYLCECTNKYTEPLSGLEKQKNFLNTHLLNWVPQFCLDIKQYADTEFYRMVGQLTSTFLQLDSMMLDQLIMSLDTPHA